MWRETNKRWRSLRWALANWADHLLRPAWIERRLVARARRSLVSEEWQRPDRLYVDISVIHQNDAGTGIQRVVREIRRYLPEVGPADLAIIPLVVRRRRDGYVTSDGQPLAGNAKCVFFGLDFATDSIVRERKVLQKFRHTGGRFWFLVHDTLPMSNPSWFTPASRVRYRRWLRVCATLADGFICVSSTVAEELADLLDRRYGLSGQLEITTISPGSNILLNRSAPRSADLPLAQGLTPEIFAHSTLMVGTLEPRKGHAELLDAFDCIWAEGRNIPLVLIGRSGWNTNDLQRRIRNHAEYGRLLFWLEGVDDDALHAAYATSKIVVVPSLAEGYGLPLDEALALGAAVLARDIPVFRRHGTMNLGYFPATADARSLAARLLDFHASAKRSGTYAPLRHWRETAAQVLETICRERSASERSGDPIEQRGR